MLPWHRCRRSARIKLCEVLRLGACSLCRGERLPPLEDPAAGKVCQWSLAGCHRARSGAAPQFRPDLNDKPGTTPPCAARSAPASISRCAKVDDPIKKGHTLSRVQDAGVRHGSACGKGTTKRTYCDRGSVRLELWRFGDFERKSAQKFSCICPATPASRLTRRHSSRYPLRCSRPGCFPSSLSRSSTSCCSWRYSAGEKNPPK